MQTQAIIFILIVVKESRNRGSPRRAVFKRKQIRVKRNNVFVVKIHHDVKGYRRLWLENTDSKEGKRSCEETSKEEGGNEK